MTPEELSEFLDGPAQEPPRGVDHDFSARGESTSMALGVVIAILVITSISAALRVYSQVFVARKVRWEDGLGLLGFGCYLAVIWVMIRFVQLDVYRQHQWNITYREFVDVLYALYINSLMFGLAMLFLKTAILIEWNRVFAPRRNKFWWICTTVCVLNALFYTVSIVMLQLYCSPHEKIWNRYLPGTCRDRRTTESPSTIFNLILDLIILLLPQRVVWKLHMTRAKKFKVSVVFSVGLLAVVAAAGRVHAAFTMDFTYDVTYDVGITALWVLGELSCALLVFCIPALPRAFGDGTMLSKMVYSLRSFTALGTSRGASSGSGGGGSNGSRWWRSRELSSSAGRSSGKHAIYDNQADTDDRSDVHLASIKPTLSRGGGRPSNAYERGWAAN